MTGTHAAPLIAHCPACMRPNTTSWRRARRSPCVTSRRRTRGNLLGLTHTGRWVHWDAVDVYHLAYRMMVEEWAADNIAAVLRQAGAHTPPRLAT